jgi:hypothetical protein
VVAVTIKEQFPAGMFITAEDPVRSLRSQVFSEGELILVGGESHKTGQGKDMNTHYKNLIDFARGKNTFQMVIADLNYISLLSVLIVYLSPG